MTDLSRFHTAQAETYESALDELRVGHKQTHWMWFIFPQLVGLGRSDRARFYGIRDLPEARAYLADPVLGPRLTQAAEAVLSHPDQRIDQIMGHVDAVKLRSCATLFEVAGGGEVFDRIIDTFYEGMPCPLTLKALDH